MELFEILSSLFPVGPTELSRAIMEARKHTLNFAERVSSGPCWIGFPVWDSTWNFLGRCRTPFPVLHPFPYILSIFSVSVITEVACHWCLSGYPSVVPSYPPQLNTTNVTCLSEPHSPSHWSWRLLNGASNDRIKLFVTFTSDRHYRACQ